MSTRARPPLRRLAAANTDQMIARDCIEMGFDSLSAEFTIASRRTRVLGDQRGPGLCFVPMDLFDENGYLI